MDDDNVTYPWEKDGADVDEENAAHATGLLVLTCKVSEVCNLAVRSDGAIDILAQADCCVEEQYMAA